MVKAILVDKDGQVIAEIKFPKRKLLPDRISHDGAHYDRIGKSDTYTLINGESV